MHSRKFLGWQLFSVWKDFFLDLQGQTFQHVPFFDREWPSVNHCWEWNNQIAVLLGLGGFFCENFGFFFLRWVTSVSSVIFLFYFSDAPISKFLNFQNEKRSPFWVDGSWSNTECQEMILNRLFSHWSEITQISSWVFSPGWKKKLYELNHL